MFSISLLCGAAKAKAGEIEPRTYTNTPIGVKFLLMGYTLSDGNLATQGSSPLKDAHLTFNSVVAAYARSRQFRWGREL